MVLLSQMSGTTPTPGEVKTQRFSVELASGEIVSGYKVIHSQWFVSREHPGSSGWSVIHIPSGMPIKDRLPSKAKALDLVFHIQANLPDLPAMQKLTFGKSPTKTQTPKAFQEAKNLLAVINRWTREN